MSVRCGDCNENGCGAPGHSCYCHNALPDAGEARLLSAVFNLNGEAEKLKAEERDALLESFAMRAPACPDWFVPEGVAPYPVLPPLPAGLGPDALRLASDIRLGEHSCVDEKRLTSEEGAFIAGLRESMADYRKAREARALEYQEKRHGQWPWHHAALVLAARPGGAK